MSYIISDKDIKDPIIKQILGVLNPIFNKLEVNGYLIGATARDIVFSRYKISPKRATRDLDIAVAVSDWAKYFDLEAELLKQSDFKKDKAQRQRYIFKEIFPVDFVPFGGIRQRDDKIYWPPDESVAMSVLCFEEVEKDALLFETAPIIKVASLAGIFILKLIAWRDRHKRSKKDANDMAFIIENYLIINEERALDKYYDEIYADKDFTLIIGGAVLLANDMSEILKDNPKAISELWTILNTELNAKESGRLVNQIMETNTMFKYEETSLCIRKMSEVLKQNSQHMV